MTQILILTDLHLSNTKGNYNLFLNLTQKIIQNHGNKFKAIFILGDTSHDGKLDDYNFLIKTLKNNFPTTRTHIICGNHDNQKLLKSSLAHSKTILFSEMKYILISNTCFIFLKTKLHSQIKGKAHIKSIALLKHILENTSKNIVILLHHHIIPVSAKIDQYILKNRKSIINLIKKYPNRIRYVFNGHTHQFQETKIKNTNVISLPSGYIQYNPTKNEQFYTLLKIENLKII